MKRSLAVFFLVLSVFLVGAALYAVHDALGDEAVDAGTPTAADGGAGGQTCAGYVCPPGWACSRSSDCFPPCVGYDGYVVNQCDGDDLLWCVEDSDGDLVTPCWAPACLAAGGDCPLV